MFVVGTAGHIDHGKSALVKALSGIDPDRLPEEKLRGLTIDLGFAWFELPSGEPVGVVDVPGHERFIKNMVAGVGGIDVVMLVIAADDGWMPQTAEHLDILELLEIKTGIVVLTKTDLVDSEMVELQADDIASRLKGTFLENSPILPFSAKDNSGRNEILNTLQSVIGDGIERFSCDSPRLYIDRSFIIKGMGTVVTGTLLEGEIKVGQELEICPAAQKVRTRGLQTHKQSIEEAKPGSRVAVNLTGAGKDDAQRGSALVAPGHFEPSDTLGVKIKMLPGVKHPLKNASEILVLLGTSIAHAKLKLFSRKVLAAAEEDFAVLHLDKEICCRIGDRFVVRRLSPAITVAGGTVLDWDFGSIKKGNATRLEILKIRENLDLDSIIKSELLKDKNISPAKLKLNSRFDESQIREHVARAGNIVKAAGSLVHKEHLEKYLEPAKKALKEEHESRTWSRGLPVGRLSKKLKLPAKEVDEVIAYLISSGTIVQEAGILRLKSHVPSLNPNQKALADKLHAVLSASPLASPLKKKFIAEDPAFEIVIDFLCEKGDLLELKNGVLFTHEDFQEVVEKVVALMKSEGKVTASQVKDHLKTTRKYIIPLLEKLDSIDVTRRDGDFRIQGQNQGDKL
ncbi:MAG: selenocysteine-specific translation elongation factor [candidate division Zixibacteria bacterium]|nr:selenocysteine-specific translation elongation factor [candidate division Zixibacteria bacterium]